jgi:hypothetical protein
MLLLVETEFFLSRGESYYLSAFFAGREPDFVSYFESGERHPCPSGSQCAGTDRTVRNWNPVESG